MTGSTYGSAWKTELRQSSTGASIAVIYLDVPGEKQNILTSEVMDELNRLLDIVEKEVIPSGVRGLVVASGKEGSFIAGADIREIDGITDPETARYKATAGQKILGRLAKLSAPDSPVTTVAAINGYCFGGGCELALACGYRIAAQDPKVQIGLPETKLGIIPGFAGTQRMPRVVGVPTALDLILTGKALDAKKALKKGLVDRIVAPALLLGAAVEMAAQPPGRRRQWTAADRFLSSAAGRWIAFAMARRNTRARVGNHYPALFEAIDVMAETLGAGPIGSSITEADLLREAEGFGKVVVTDVSRNLRHLFFLSESQKKYAPYQAKPRPVARAAVLGAGVMGGGIAWAFSSQGIPVRVKDIAPEPLLGALKVAAKIYRGSVERRKATPSEAEHGLARIGVGLDYAGFDRTDLVVEAVVEKMDVKKAVLKEVEGRLRPEAVLATNTSGLSITEMATVLERPERFGGLHFFNPVHRMPLVEVVVGTKTSDETIAALFGAARLLRKTPVMVADSPGFLVNRILIPYILEAARMLEEGIDPLEIDAAALEFGMPMGPLRLADEVGLDIGLHVARHLQGSFGARMSVPALLPRLVEARLLGKKTGKGIFLHAGGGGLAGKMRAVAGRSDTVVNPEALAVIGSGAPSELPRMTITDRLFLTMLLEAVRCLEDRVVKTPEEIDIAMIYGTGFPPFRGGLMRWGASMGRGMTLRKTGELEQRYGARFGAPEMLKDILHD